MHYLIISLSIIIKHPKTVLYTTRHYYARKQLFHLKRQQYELLVQDASQNALSAAKLARDANAFNQRWSKYLDYAPVI